LELVEAAVRLNECILDEFRSVVGVAEEPEGDGRTLALVLLSQFPEGFAAPAFSGENQGQLLGRLLGLLLSKLGGLGFGGFGRKKKDAPAEDNQNANSNANANGSGNANGQPPPATAAILMEMQITSSDFSNAPLDESHFAVPEGFRQLDPKMH